MNKITEIEQKNRKMFAYFEDIALFNQEKVLKAFQKNKVAGRHFAGTTGYGYDDVGRDTLAKVFADVFGAEKAIVSPLFTCGSHAISTALFGLLRPGDVLLSVAGKPYDTLDETIFGKEGENNGSLKDFGVQYTQVDLKDGVLDEKTILRAVSEKKPKVVYLQKSRGYAWRNSISVAEMAKLFTKIRKIDANCFIMVDNCYGEFTEKQEPIEVGADVAVGSLIKNPGGGLAPTGGYIAGTTRAIDLIAGRFTSPSLGLAVGSYENGYRNFYHGLFLAPHTVLQALKGTLLIGTVMESLGHEVFPASNQKTFDIVKSIQMKSKEELIKFVQMIQKLSPVDSFAVPMPWAMPGYTDEVIMAAGTFVAGSSIELSCDSPIRKPYIAYLQGGLTYEHAKLVALELLK